MNRNYLFVLTACTALGGAMAAQAQDASSTISISGEVSEACLVGQPTTTTLNIVDLTGSDGRITPALASTAEAVSTDIETAWCNAPSILTLTGDPMALTVTPSYGTPTGFARLIAYDATLSGWPSSIVVRPLTTGTSDDTTADGAHQSPLELVISRLAAIDGAGSENAQSVLEAGGYAGSVTVSVSVQ